MPKVVEWHIRDNNSQIRLTRLFYLLIFLINFLYKNVPTTNENIIELDISSIADFPVNIAGNSKLIYKNNINKDI